MFLLSVVVNIFLSLYITNPLYLFNDYIKDLLITSDPNTYLTTPQIIRRYGYPAESHIIQTEDGYLLEVHRIPFGKTTYPGKDRYPVLLCHGIFFSSANWVINPPSTSLAFQLADQGYDVWLLNSRGNSYSRGHVNYTPKQKEFWDYSVHELGVYDLPATIDHILLTTGHQQLIVVGHSLGTAIFYIMASTLHPYADKIKAQISFAPIATIPHKSPFDIIMLISFGFDPQQYDKNASSAFASHYIDGSSVKLLVHVAQFWLPGKHSFSNFDYGKQENLLRYGTPKPPFYNLSSISTPVRIYHADNDPIADGRDSKALYEKLPNGAGLIRVKDPAFNHFDFIQALDVNPLVNDDVLQFIHNVTNIE